MTNRTNPQHGANMVDRYIGSAFDIVYAVYKELDRLPVIYDFAIEYVPKIEQIIVGNTEILGKLTEIDQAVLTSTEEADRAKEEADRAANLDFNIRQDLKDPDKGAKIVQYDENNTVYDAIKRNREDFWANKETMGGIYTHYVREDDGTPVAGAECAVYVGKTGVLATGLKDKFGEPLANPFVSDANGLVQFVTDPGMYTLQVSFNLVVHTYSVYFADGGLRNDLADPDMGAGMVGYDGGTLADKLTEIQNGYERTLTAGANISIDRTDPDNPMIYMSDVLSLTAYTVSTAPDPTDSPNGIIMVSDGDSGEQCIAVSNGTEWLRIALGAAISL